MMSQEITIGDSNQQESTRKEDIMELISTKKRAVVTGGSRGIGRAIALALVHEGAEVCITYRTNDAAAKETLTLLEKAGASYPIALKGEVSDENFAREVAIHMKDIFDGVDILVNNAGITDDGLLVRMKTESFNNVITSNLNGAFFMLRELTPFMLKQRYGRIVNISSIAGVKGNAGQVNYSASKAGLIGLTLSAAKELGSKGITVNAVAPGLIDTDMTRALNENQLKQALSAITANRFGKPEEVADLVCFLSSEKAAYITGQVIAIDGGLVI